MKPGQHFCVSVGTTVLLFLLGFGIYGVQDYAKNDRKESQLTYSIIMIVGGAFGFVMAVGYIKYLIEGCIRNRNKKLLEQQNLPPV